MRKNKALSIDISGVDDTLKQYNALLKESTKIDDLMYKRVNRSIRRSLHKEVKKKGYAIKYEDFANTLSLYTLNKKLQLSSRSRRLSLSEDRIKMSRGKKPKISIKIKKQTKTFNRPNDFFLVRIRGRTFVATRRYYTTNQKLVTNNYTKTIAGSAGRSDKRFRTGEYSKYNISSRQVRGREKINTLRSISIGNEFRETFLNTEEGQKKIITIFENSVAEIIEKVIEKKINPKKQPKR